MKFKYVGLKKDGETAFAELTGIPVWMPGDQYDIASPSAAARMRMHPDVWEPVIESAAAVVAAPAPAPAASPVPSSVAPIANTGSVSVGPGAVIGAGQTISAASNNAGSPDRDAGQGGSTEAPPVVISPPGGDVTLTGMDRDALKALADKLGVTVHHAAGAPKITAALVGAFPPKAADAGETQQ